jgi:cytochrome P450
LLTIETALNAYEPLVTKCTQQLIEIIDQKLDTPIDMSIWATYYAFEVMANLAFGKPFNMLTEQTESYFLKVMRQDMKLVGYLRHLPWLTALLMRTPGINWNNQQFWRWLEGQISERIEVSVPRPAIPWGIANGPSLLLHPERTSASGHLFVCAQSIYARPKIKV